MKFFEKLPDEVELYFQIEGVLNCIGDSVGYVERPYRDIEGYFTYSTTRLLVYEDRVYLPVRYDLDIDAFCYSIPIDAYTKSGLSHYTFEAIDLPPLDLITTRRTDCKALKLFTKNPNVWYIYYAYAISKVLKNDNRYEVIQGYGIPDRDDIHYVINKIIEDKIIDIRYLDGKPYNDHS